MYSTVFVCLLSEVMTAIAWNCFLCYFFLPTIHIFPVYVYINICMCMCVCIVLRVTMNNIYKYILYIVALYFHLIWMETHTIFQLLVLWMQAWLKMVTQTTMTEWHTLTTTPPSTTTTSNNKKLNILMAFQINSFKLFALYGNVMAFFNSIFHAI